MFPCNLHRIIAPANELHNGILAVLIKPKIIASNFKLQLLIYNIIVEQFMLKPEHGPNLCKLVKRKKIWINLALWNSGRIAFNWH